MNQYWKQIETVFNKKGNVELLKLNNGATMNELNELEQLIGLELPVSFKDFYSIHNGQSSTDGRGFFFGIRLLSIEEIKNQWSTWVGLENDNLNEDLSDSMESSPNGVVKPQYLNRKWIPFTHDRGGNHIGIDFDPDSKGKFQQVISFGRDEDIKKLKADSFELFISKFVGYLESIEWSLNAEKWDIKDKIYDVHFHDWGKF